MWARAKAVGLVLLVAWAIVPFGGLDGNGANGSVAGPREYYLVGLDSPASIGLLSNLGIEIVTDYGNGYYLARGGLDDSAYLENPGIRVRGIPDRTVLRFAASGYEFDTGASTPSIPPELTSINSDERVVQFIGPIKSEWVKAVEDLGIGLEEYVESFAFVARMDDAQASAARSLPFVNWVGTYEPAYKVQSELLEMDGAAPVSVVAHEGVTESELRSFLESLGAEVTMTWTSPVTAEAVLDASLIPAVARSPDVLSVFWSPEAEPADWASGEIMHFHDAWVPLRSGIPWNLTGRSPGPDGIQGTADDVFEVVGIQDTGFDGNNANGGWADMFSGPLGDRAIRLAKWTSDCNRGPDGRYSGAGHGTVVVGTVLSNGYAWEAHYGEPVNDSVWDKSEAGVVPEGVLTFDCVGQGGGILFSPTYWDTEYLDNARTFSNSFGSANRVYDATATAVDVRTDASNDKMFLFAAMNNGPEENTVSGMSKGKNGLSIGAAENYRPDRYGADRPGLMATFSSRGNPAERFKPDLVAIGTVVVTGLAYGEWLYNAAPTGSGNPQPEYIPDVDIYNWTSPGNFNGDGIPDYRYYSGTSVATPNAAGLYMLTREYFREAYGIDNVNSQLAKAMLINGAVRMDSRLYEYPGIDQGWGRVDLEQSLFPPAPRTNQWEEGFLATTGTWAPSGINTLVSSPDVPLKVTLVWIDSASAYLSRDLDLVVHDPTGTLEYHGNQYAKSGPLDGWTDPNDTGYDNINNVEQVEVLAPTPGLWSVEVRGVSIPAMAKFALVFSADVNKTRSYQVSLSTDSPVTVEVAPGGTASLPFNVRSFGKNNDTVAIIDDAPANISTAYDWIETQFRPNETIGNLAMFTAPSNAKSAAYPFRVCGVSKNDTVTPPASDCISVKVLVIAEMLPPRYSVTSGDGDEMDPSVLTFNSAGLNHIFVAYKKTTALNQSNTTHGGVNVYVAHNTLNASHVPNGTWIESCVSDWNDQPTDIRILSIDNGTFEGRVVITWGGKDPLEPNSDARPYGRIAFSDLPYSTWTLRTIQKNYGTNVYNNVRMNFPVFRRIGGPNGTLAWVWEHLDSVSATSGSIGAVQIQAAFSNDGGNSWSDCYSGLCYLIAPPSGDINFSFFPNGVVDQNDVLWVFFHTRSPTGSSNRRLTVSLWDGATWNTGWTWPINIWEAGTGFDIRYPAAVSTPEGGNRIYAAVTYDNGSLMEKIYALHAEGAFGSGIVGPPPRPAPSPGISPDFSTPEGPMGESVLTTRYDEGPAISIVATEDGLVWISNAEGKEVLGGRSDLETWSSPDGFANRTRLNVTLDTYGKGHQMSDSLTIGSKSCVYEVWHESRESFEKARYAIRLATYCDGWQNVNDTVGPITQNPATIPNPYEKTHSTSLKVTAYISDVSTGYSNITAAELVLTDTSVNDSSLVDWTNAWAMNLSGVNRSPVETAWLWANDTAAGWPIGSCHRFWIRGQDSTGNWGTGNRIDVCVIAPRPPGAAQMTKAELAGSGFANVIITWSRSPDDGAGDASVVDYTVWRSEQIGGPYIITAKVRATGSQNYSWTDYGAGHGDPHDYFYYVTAGSAYHDSPPTRLAAKFHRVLDAGKQLVSFPLEQANYDPAVVFQTFSYSYVRTYVAGTPNPWWCHKPGRFGDSLTELSVLQGYWVDVDGPGTMTVAGLVPNNLMMTLKSGWNMIGFPSFNKSYTFADLDAAVGGALQLVEIYDASAGPYYLQKVLRNKWSTTYLQAGYAYTVRVSVDVDWLIPGP